jgi:hypothetical protein
MESLAIKEPQSYAAALLGEARGAPLPVPTSFTTEILLDKNDAAAEAVEVLNRLRSGPRAVIDACARTSDTIERFRDNPRAIDQFLTVLADGGVISHREAKLGLSSPKLSMMCQVGAHAVLLCRDEVLQYFVSTGCAGYTLCYQTTVLYRSFQGDERARFDQLVLTLQARRPDSRKSLIDLTKEVKRAQVKVSDRLEKGSSFDDGPAQFDLIFAQLNHRYDLRRLREDYADKLPRCLRIHDRVSEEAFAVIVTRLADLPIVENRLLPGFGFASITRILLLRNPSGADVTDEQVVIVAARSGTSVDRLPDFQWLPNDEPMDADCLALQLAPNARNKLHVFASAEAEGWSSIVGEANWSHADE